MQPKNSTLEFFKEDQWPKCLEPHFYIEYCQEQHFSSRCATEKYSKFAIDLQSRLIECIPELVKEQEMSHPDKYDGDQIKVKYPPYLWNIDRIDKTFSLYEDKQGGQSKGRVLVNEYHPQMLTDSSVYQNGQPLPLKLTEDQENDVEAARLRGGDAPIFRK